MSQDTTHLTFGAYLKAYFKQCLEVFKHPKMLLPTVILAVVWIGLGILQNKVGRNLPLSILNFLTYAQGGLYGGILGAIGGILGKIVVAAFVNIMIVPLFYKKNPFANFKQGFQEIIANIKFESKDATALLLKSSGTALLLYSIFNVTQSRENSLVGIVSIVALISAAARKQGFLWGLVISFMNSISKGKVPSYQRVVRVLSGMTLGFTLGVALSTVGFVWVGLLGVIALIVGLILGKKNSKKVVAATVLMLLFLLPKGELFADSAGVWKLVDAKTETNPTTKGDKLKLTATISGTTNSWRIDFSWEDVVGQIYGSMPPFQGSYAPGHNYIGYYEVHQEHTTNKLIWPVTNSLNVWWKIYYGKDRDKVNPIVGRRCLGHGEFSCTFPTLEEAGSEYIIVEESVEIREAYIRTLYYFKWDAMGKAGNNSSSTDGKWDDLNTTLPHWINKLFGTDGEHTSDVTTILIGILGVLGGLGGGLGGALGGGIGGGGNAPTGEGPTGGNDPAPKKEPTPEELEWQRYQKEKEARFKKYLTDNPDGTKTYIDPATCQKHTLYPKYNTETGEFTHWENENDTPYDEAKLNDWLAWRERNSEHFAQNEAQAQQNLAEQRALNQAQNDYDRERHSSAAADAHKAFKEQCEHAVFLGDLALKHGFVNANDLDSLKKTILKDKHEALEEGAKAMNDAAYWNDKSYDVEFYEHAADVLINVMGEYPGNRMAKNIYTVAKSIIKHGTESKVKGDSVWGGIGQGAVEGGLSVLQNQEMTGLFGTSVVGKLTKAGVNIGAETAKSIFNDLMDPTKSASDILDNATKAGINRLYFEGMGEATKTYGGFASDAATPSGVDEIGSFAQEVGFHTESANALADKINFYRHKFFGI